MAQVRIVTERWIENKNSEIIVQTTFNCLIWLPTQISNRELLTPQWSRDTAMVFPQEHEVKNKALQFSRRLNSCSCFYAPKGQIERKPQPYEHRGHPTSSHAFLTSSQEYFKGLWAIQPSPSRTWRVPFKAMCVLDWRFLNIQGGLQHTCVLDC